MAHLKLELHRQLDRARSATLVERIEAAILPSHSEGVRQHLRRAAEQRARQRAGGAAEVGMIQRIEEPGAEAQPHALPEPNDPPQPEIGLRGSEPAQHVAPEIALLPGRRGEENSWCTWRARAGDCTRRCAAKSTASRVKRCATRSATAARGESKWMSITTARQFQLRARDNGTGIDPQVRDEGAPATMAYRACRNAPGGWAVNWQSGANPARAGRSS